LVQAALVRQFEQGCLIEATPGCKVRE